MSEKIINGRLVPYELSNNELAYLCSSKEMSDFVVACEVLSTRDNQESYQILKSHFYDKDKYRRLIVIKAIFHLSYSVELNTYLETLLQLEDILFVHTASNIIVSKRISVSENMIKETLIRYIDDIEVGYLLTLISNLDYNFGFVESLFMKSSICGYQEIIADFLYSNFGKDKPQELFDLFRSSHFGKIRCYALSIGKDNQFDLSSFLYDKDGHVRKKLAFFADCNKQISI